MTAPAQWWDDFLVSDEGALHRMLVGKTVTVKTVEHVGPPESGDTVEEEFQVTVWRVKRAAVGIDSHGLFVGIVCEVDRPAHQWLSATRQTLTFYADGVVADRDDARFGTFVPSDLNVIAQMAL